MIGVGRKPADKPGDGRIGRHPAIDTRLVTQVGDVGQTVTTQRERERQVTDDLARIVHRERFAPPGQLGRQHPIQASRPDRLDQQQTASLPNRGNLGAVDMNAGIQAVMLHLEGAPSHLVDSDCRKPYPPKPGAPSPIQHTPAGTPP